MIFESLFATPSGEMTVLRREDISIPRVREALLLQRAGDQPFLLPPSLLCWHWSELDPCECDGTAPATLYSVTVTSRMDTVGSPPFP